MKTQNKWQRIGIILIAIMIGVPEYLSSQNVTDIDISNEPNGQENNLDAVKFVKTPLI